MIEGAPALPRISVLIATAARSERRSQLVRALDCVRSQVGVKCVPIVVANGPHQDPAVVEYLEAQRDIRLFSIETGNYPFALKFARSQVETEWFSQMDDDDELRPNALVERYRVASTMSDLDAVISNGITRYPWGDEIRVPDFDGVRRDPLRALVRFNWLSPGAGLYRASAMTEEVFAAIPQYLEWTYVALTLALRNKLAFIEEPLYVYHEQSPHAISRSDAYVLGLPAALEQILKVPMPADVRKAFQTKLSSARNSAAMLCMRRGDARSAWCWHLRTLLGKGGYAYALATRHFLSRVDSNT